MATEVDLFLMGVPIDMLQPNILLGARKPLAPEQRLMIAVVQDAINCLEKYRFATDPRGRQLFAEVTEWLDAAQPGWPYSFESICEVLGLDATAVRHRLGLAQDQHRGHVACQMSRPDSNGGAVEMRQR